MLIHIHDSAIPTPSSHPLIHSLHRPLNHSHNSPPTQSDATTHIHVHVVHTTHKLLSHSHIQWPTHTCKETVYNGCSISTHKDTVYNIHVITLY